MHHLVDIVDGDAQALQDMGSGFGLREIKARPSDDHLAPVIEEDGEGALQVQHDGLVVHHGQHIDAEGRLEGRVLEEGVGNDVRDGALFEIDDHADAVAVGLIAQVGDALDLLLVHERGDALHHDGFVHAVGDLIDDEGLQPLLPLLDPHAPADADAAASGMVGLIKPLAGVDFTLCREVRALDELHEVVNRGLRIVEQGGQGVAELAQIVRGDVGGHAHGDAR